MAECLKLNKSNCENCYKCIRTCPVKSIRFSDNQAHIIEDECIYCGKCDIVCPQNAGEIADGRQHVKSLLANEKVIASIDPAFIANYGGCGIESMEKALKELGFFAVEETAIGATMVKNEYVRMMAEETKDVIITSSCYAMVLLIRKYYPELIPCLADVMSPMQAHCRDIRRRYPDAKTVYIGPCIARKAEMASCKGDVDEVLTFKELSSMLAEKNILPEKKLENSREGRCRLFALPGGIVRCVEKDSNGYTCISFDGVRSCMRALDGIKEGRLHKCFIEMSSCKEGCVGGPAMEQHNSAENYVAAVSYAGHRDFQVEQPDISDLKAEFTDISIKNTKPEAARIREILYRLGQEKATRVLNCGYCGYATCRDFAEAVYLGKTDLSSCMPYSNANAASFSDMIVSNSPEGMVLLNNELEIKQINQAAMKTFDIKDRDSVLGQPVSKIINPVDFNKVLRSGEDIYDKKIYLKQYKRYLEETIVRDGERNMILWFLEDVTEDEKERQRKEDISKQTAEVADRVVYKQMRIVQEIASLLGETAAETKSALYRLKEHMDDE